jgi:hypothetical protein
MQLLEGLLAGERRATPLQSPGGTRASTLPVGEAVPVAGGVDQCGTGNGAGGSPTG